MLTLFVVVASVCSVAALLQCLTLIRQHQLTTADVTVQDLKIADYGNFCVELLSRDEQSVQCDRSGYILL